eukprot:TRINITY_DN11063_c0_g1_i1.p1 TRINITY_DN11063_c0_g1~~TRINITY_DN11063_c0_g1_i1.p1  ORF type:complete len:191 (+),score=32.50 TRINITY_DN11063_c0_g1_i1:61-633(+)
MSTAPQFIGVSIPGQLPIMQWTQVTPQRFVSQAAITQPVSHLSIFLLGNVPLPSTDLAAALYMLSSLDPSGQWHFAGAVTNANPADVCTFPFSVTQPCQIQLGISIEPAAGLPAKPPLPSAAPTTAPLFSDQDLMMLGTSVAKDFFTYLESFSGPGDQITIPGNSLNIWLQKFTARTKRDPLWWKSYKSG